MIEIEKPKIETIEINDDAKYGKFVVEPLERGYGTTLGNSLRRILLSSLPGAAVTSIQVDGVLHEFSTIEGVVEDVTSIILNIKKQNINLFTGNFMISSLIYNNYTSFKLLPYTILLSVKTRLGAESEPNAAKFAPFCIALFK